MPFTSNKHKKTPKTLSSEPNENNKDKTFIFADLWYRDHDSRGYTTNEVFEVLRTNIVNPETITDVMVGTDSHSFGKYYHFVTVLCFHNRGKGGMYFYHSSIEPRKTFNGSQKLRLLNEVTKSLTIANELFEALGVKANIHLDASPSYKSEFTSSFADQLKGYVISSGYEATLKPESIAASAIADRHSRKKMKKSYKIVTQQ